MDKLYIDIGNSFIKAAVPAAGKHASGRKGNGQTVELKSSSTSDGEDSAGGGTIASGEEAANGDSMKWAVEFRTETGNEQELYDWLEQRHRERGNRETEEIVVCSVVKRISGELERRLPAERFRLLTYKNVPEELLDYQTPETLGMDRFLPCFGAVRQISGSVVVIDAGSACTLDYMSGDSVFYGGVIMPGLKLLRQSMLQQLPALPRPGEALPDRWPGKSTLDSVRWGTTGMFTAAVNRFLRRIENDFGPFTLFLTGGDAPEVLHCLEADLSLAGTGLPGGGEKIRVAPSLLFDGMRALVSEDCS